jgi:type I restriction enzyme S subunit
MKDSGVAWIGEVPEHWDIKPVYSVATVRNGYPFKSELFKTEGIESDRLIRIRDIIGDDDQIFTEEVCPGNARISNGDVVIGMDGDFNVHRWLRGPAKLNQRMCAVAGRSEAITKFLSKCLSIPLLVINDLVYATTVKHLSSYEVLHSKIPVPPADELNKINSALDRETSRIDDLIAKVQRSIDLLKERRSAFITAAVTGQIDLRESA